MSENIEVNISDEAVEAAREAVRAAMIEYGPDGHTDGDEEITRAALEAAAPHLMAEAWGEGHESGFWNGRLSQLTVPYDAPEPEIGVEHAKSHNPYRSAGAGE